MTDAYACPDCGAALVAGEFPGILTCPTCRREYASPDAVTEPPTEPLAPPPPPAPPAEHELSALRIRQFATARRAAYRARSYAVIAAAVCVIAIVQLIWMTIRQVRTTGWGKQPIGYALFALIALLGVGYFISRALALHREAKMSALPDPTTPPDFSTLDDGSKRWKNLEDVR